MAVVAPGPVVGWGPGPVLSIARLGILAYMKRREIRMDWVWPIGLAVVLASIIIFFIV